MADEPKKKAVLENSLLKGFVAGVVVSHINKRLIVGFLVGTLAGAYIQQNYDNIPDVQNTAKDWLNTIRRSTNEGASNPKDG